MTLKCCCFPRKLGKQIKFVTFFCLHDRRNSRHFSNLEPKVAHAYNVFRSKKNQQIPTLYSRPFLSGRTQTSRTVQMLLRKAMETFTWSQWLSSVNISVATLNGRTISDSSNSLKDETSKHKLKTRHKLVTVRIPSKGVLEKISQIYKLFFNKHWPLKREESRRKIAY